MHNRTKRHNRQTQQTIVEVSPTQTQLDQIKAFETLRDKAKREIYQPIFAAFGSLVSLVLLYSAQSAGRDVLAATIGDHRYREFGEKLNTAANSDLGFARLIARHPDMYNRYINRIIAQDPEVKELLGEVIGWFAQCAGVSDEALMANPSFRNHHLGIYHALFPLIDSFRRECYKNTFFREFSNQLFRLSKNDVDMLFQINRYPVMLYLLSSGFLIKILADQAMLLTGKLMSSKRPKIETKKQAEEYIQSLKNEIAKHEKTNDRNLMLAKLLAAAMTPVMLYAIFVADFMVLEGWSAAFILMAFPVFMTALANYSFGQIQKYFSTQRHISLQDLENRITTCTKSIEGLVEITNCEGTSLSNSYLSLEVMHNYIDVHRMEECQAVRKKDLVQIIRKVLLEEGVNFDLQCGIFYINGNNKLDLRSSTRISDKIEESINHFLNQKEFRHQLNKIAEEMFVTVDSIYLPDEQGKMVQHYYIKVPNEYASVVNHQRLKDLGIAQPILHEDTGICKVFLCASIRPLNKAKISDFMKVLSTRKYDITRARHIREQSQIDTNALLAGKSPPKQRIDNAPQPIQQEHAIVKAPVEPPHRVIRWKSGATFDSKNPNTGVSELELHDRCSFPSGVFFTRIDPSLERKLPKEVYDEFVRHSRKLAKREKGCVGVKFSDKPRIKIGNNDKRVEGEIERLETGEVLITFKDVTNHSRMGS